MTIGKSWFLAAAVGALLSGCAAPPAGGPSATAPAAQAPRYGSFGLDTAGMDRSVAPGQDFFRYASGRWAETTEIPADRSSWNSFGILTEVANERTRALIEAAAAGGATGDARKVGDFYAAFLDEAAAEARGMAPIQAELEAIARIQDRAALSRHLGGLLRNDVDMLNATDYYTDRPFGLWVAEDMDRPERYAPYLIQGGLGMPDREYYLGDTPRFAELRTKYRAHIAEMLRLAGSPNSGPQADRAFALETAIARTHWTQLQTGDVEKGNNTWRRSDFPAKAPGIDWDAFFDAAGLGGQDVVKVWQPSAVTGMAALAASQPLQAWKDYLTFRAIERAAPFLTRAMVAEHFAFNGTALSGTPQQQERWKRGIGFTNAALGEPVGRMYVERWFPPEAKREAEAMVANIIKAFDQRIDRLDWMSPETKARAHRKVQTMTVAVGYPDQWRDYSGLEIRRDDPLGNAQRASLYDYRFDLQKLGRAVDRGEWHMLPQEVNALNAPLQNGIFFPAAILQPPFFDAAADPAINYGGVGGVIGHEIVHSFDDTGALFDETGRLANWWTPQDLARFKETGRRLAAQYSTYQPFPDVALNGEQTLGENIADVAGLSAAYDGWRLSLGGRPAPVLDGFTGDQRFFLGWAQVWRAKFREAQLRRALLTGVHSPGMYRALAVRNLDPWYAAFDVQPGQAQYLAPEQRVRIW
ncbi:MAG TPA: M13 family metallopeptidase [Caulobacteraceae bacterium]|jgi:putative endopeptidase